MLDTVQPEKQNKTNDPKLQGKGKTFKCKIMQDTVQPEWQNKKTNDLKQKGNEKTYKQKIMLDTVQQERAEQNK